jgi:hypothetical protein
MMSGVTSVETKDKAVAACAEQGDIPASNFAP